MILYTYCVRKSKKQTPFLRVSVVKPGPEPTNAQEKGEK